MYRRPLLAHTVLAMATLLALTSCVNPPDLFPDPTSSAPAPSPTPVQPSTPPASAPAITIDSPPEGAVVAVPLSVAGTANTFEATLVVDVVNPGGVVVCTRTVTATSGSGTPGTWDARIAFPPPDADIPMTIRAYSLSADDGSIQNLVERDVTVSAERPPIFLTSPVCGATMTMPGEVFLVAGRAAVFEAALSVELRNAAGTALVSENLMTEIGNEESDFSAYLTLPEGTPAGLYDLVAFSYSARDGSIQNEAIVQVLVQP